MIIGFVGHSLISSKNRVKEIVKEQIRNQMSGIDRITCYLGGYGEFDEVCACACRELKRECVEIETVYVTPYINLAGQARIKEMKNLGLCDTALYPPIENVPPKFAISKRNEWMMTNADIVIAYVEHNFGGAYKSLQVAERRKKKIINICELL